MELGGKIKDLDTKEIEKADSKPDLSKDGSDKIKEEPNKYVDKKIDVILDAEERGDSVEKESKTPFEKNCEEFSSSDKDINRIKERSGTENEDGTFIDNKTGEAYSSFEDWYNRKCDEYRKEKSRAETYRKIGDRESEKAENSEGAERVKHQEKAEEAYNKAEEAKEKADAIKKEVYVDRPRRPEDFRRPYRRVSVEQEIYDNAPKDKEGRYLDPNTGLPIEGKPDVGHKPGHEHWREAKKACDEELTQAEFNDRMNDPDLYQLEDLHNNRSGKYENKSPYERGSQ